MPLYIGREPKPVKAEGHELQQGAARDKTAKLANLAGRCRKRAGTIRSFMQNLPKKSRRYELPTKSSL